MGKVLSSQAWWPKFKSLEPIEKSKHSSSTCNSNIYTKRWEVEYLQKSLEVCGLVTLMYSIEKQQTDSVSRIWKAKTDFRGCPLTVTHASWCAYTSTQNLEERMLSVTRKPQEDKFIDFYFDEIAKVVTKWCQGLVTGWSEMIYSFSCARWVASKDHCKILHLQRTVLHIPVLTEKVTSIVRVAMLGKKTRKMEGREEGWQEVKERQLARNLNQEGWKEMNTLPFRQRCCCSYRQKSGMLTTKWVEGWELLNNWLMQSLLGNKKCSGTEWLLHNN